MPKTEINMSEGDRYRYVENLSHNIRACNTKGYEGFKRGSFANRHRNYIYLENKYIRSLESGAMVLAHELGHMVSSAVHNLQTSHKDKSIGKIWNMRSCINEKFIPSKLKSYRGERYQTEEDWADYFATKLISNYKEKHQAEWVSGRLSCSEINKYHFQSTNPLLPFNYNSDSESSHSSVLFRVIAQELYSKGTLGENCKNIAKGTGLLKCIEETK